MKNIQLKGLDRRAHLVQPEEFDELSLSSPLSTLFTDFKDYKPLTVEASMSALNAFYLLGTTQIGLLLVVDKDHELIGSVSYQELNEQQFLIKQKQGIARHQLTVGDVMVKRDKMKCLDYQAVNKMSIDDFVTVLKSQGMQYCLVTDSEQAQIRGVISARDVASRLHIKLNIEPPKTFADIFVAVNDDQHQRYAL